MSFTTVKGGRPNGGLQHQSFLFQGPVHGLQPTLTLFGLMEADFKTAQHATIFVPHGCTQILGFLKDGQVHASWDEMPCILCPPLSSKSFPPVNLDFKGLSQNQSLGHLGCVQFVLLCCPGPVIHVDLGRKPEFRHQSSEHPSQRH